MAGQHVITATPETFASEVEESTVPVVVDFWAPWCGPCQMLSPVLDQIAEEKAGSVKVVKVNTDDHGALAAKYGVRALPTLIFFQGGAEKDRVLGMAGKQAILDKIEALSL